MSVVEYRSVRIERGAWPRFTRSVEGGVSQRTADAGGAVWALFALGLRQLWSGVTG
jgi:hypothetical protein